MVELEVDDAVRDVSYAVVVDVTVAFTVVTVDEPNWWVCRGPVEVNRTSDVDPGPFAVPMPVAKR